MGSWVHFNPCFASPPIRDGHPHMAATASDSSTILTSSKG